MIIYDRLLVFGDFKPQNPTQKNPQMRKITHGRFWPHLTMRTPLKGQIHITLHGKRFDYQFFDNRFPDYDSAASRQQSHGAFYCEIVRLFRIITDRQGFLKNVAETETYLIQFKRYDPHILKSLKVRFARSQTNNPRRFPWNTKDFLTVSKYYLEKRLEALRQHNR
jgi:hypothetical protein